MSTLFTSGQDVSERGGGGLRVLNSTWVGRFPAAGGTSVPISWFGGVGTVGRTPAVVDPLVPSDGGVDMGTRPGASWSTLNGRVRGRGRPRGWWVSCRVRISLYGPRLHGVLLSWTGHPLACEARDVPGLRGRDLLNAASEVAMSLLKRGDSRRVEGKVSAPVEPDGFSSVYPVLWSHLVQDKWEDGSARATGSLLVFSQDGMLKGMLRDKEHGLCLWVASHSVTGLLEALEAGASDPETEWRVDRQAPGDKAKRTKRSGG